MASTSFKQKVLLQLLKKKNALRNGQAQGFTLIELLVVIVIIGALGAIGYPIYINQLQQANENSAQIATTSAAKSCAVLQATGDEDDFEVGVNTGSANVAWGGGVTCPTAGTGVTFTATFGAGGTSGSGQAVVTSDGAVIPG